MVSPLSGWRWARRILAQSRGTTLLDVALALFVLSVAVVGTLAAVSAAAEGVARARRVTAAALAADEVLAELDNKSFAFATGTMSGTWDTPWSGGSTGVPAGTWTATTDSPGIDDARLKRVSVSVYWPPASSAALYGLSGYMVQGFRDGR